MSTIVSRNVSDLPEPERLALERILDRPLQPGEMVHVIVEVLPLRRKTSKGPM